jgi:Multicopper oxidase
MLNRLQVCRVFAALIVVFVSLPAGAQSFIVQCPTSTLLHPSAPTSNQGEPAYSGPAAVPNVVANGVRFDGSNTEHPAYISNGGAIKCQQISGGDGLMTEADGNQTFMFSFGPLSGLDKILNGQAGTDFPDEFNQAYCNGSGTYNNGQPNPYDGISNPLNTTAGAPPVACGANGAVGFLPPAAFRPAAAIPPAGGAVLSNLTASSTTPTGVGGVIISDPGAGYASTPNVVFASPQVTNGCTSGCVTATGKAVIGNGSVIEVAIQNPGNGYTAAPAVSFVATSLPSSIPNTDVAAIMNTGVMNGNIPAPEMAFDEDDEFFLTLTNVGMIMRPDLFEQHTVHFHGYPNASSFYDGVPDASLAINIGGSFTYYYLAPDAGTYFWHCHITPPEHLQMGMVGQLYVRPRQNRALAGTSLPAVAAEQQRDLRTACYSGGESNLHAGTSGTTPSADILCSTPPPAPLAAGATAPTVVAAAAGASCKGPQGQVCYVYNDGDGSTFYDIDVPMQIHGFDPNFHFVGMTFNPEGFADMKDKYFLLNGRSYPDTVGVPALSAQGWTGGVPTGTANPDPATKAILTAGTDAQQRPSQPISTLIVLSQTLGAIGPQRAALRISDLDVTEYQTLASLGIPMQLVGFNAKLLRDQAGNNLYYTTNSITLGGGESLDVILDACAVRQGPPTYACTTPVPQGTYFLYTPNLDHLSNDAENFGGLMTEVVVTP